MTNLFDRPLGRATKLILIACSVTIGIPTFLLTLWLITFIDLSPSDDCQIGSVSKCEYRDLFQRAKTLGITAWPKLSKGIFRPNNRSYFGPTNASYSSDVVKQLTDAILELAPNRQNADSQLAAAHAVMSAMQAEYVSRDEVAAYCKNGRLDTSAASFIYFIPQIRFAPLCLSCLLFWDSTFIISFTREIKAGTYAFNSIHYAGASPLYDPDKKGSRNVRDGTCPSFLYTPYQRD